MIFDQFVSVIYYTKLSQNSLLKVRRVICIFTRRTDYGCCSDNTRVFTFCEKNKRFFFSFLKLDMHKAYEIFDWTILRIILVQIGLSYDIVACIMGCITSTRFFILKNGVSSELFIGSRGI